MGREPDCPNLEFGCPPCYKGLNPEKDQWCYNCTMFSYLALRAWQRRANALHERIVEWSKAYPLDVFPKPDLLKARGLLEQGGMTLDAISADNMRHVVERLAPEARALRRLTQSARITCGT
jgi:hypothetical protein